MNLFEHVREHYSCYPVVLGYNYLNNMSQDLLKELNRFEFVFIASDFHEKIPGCTAIQVMTSAQHPDTVMWLEQDFSGLTQMPPSEWTEVPSVGFVGRLPMFFDNDKNMRIHRGFESRFAALYSLSDSTEICTDFHIHQTPDGDSAGFWNPSRPDYKKNAPLFKNNMLANQYQLCARGNANWSLRFYEALAYGRIPVFVESGGKWPILVGNTNDLNELSGGCPFPIIYDIADIELELLEFHEMIKDSQGLKDCQTDCRHFYDDWFSQSAQIREFDYRFGGV